MRNTLSSWTTFGIGGAARRIDVAHTRERLVELSDGAFVLGRGSNVLASDDGYDGNIVVNRYERMARRGDTVTVGSGARLAVLCGYLAENGLSGLEWASGIPGTVGGAVKMNAGAFGSDVADVLVYADVLRAGGVVRLSTAELGLGYRTSSIADTDVVLEATFLLGHDTPSAIRARSVGYNALRRKSQPSGKSAGSVFKNPPGISVGAELDRAGLKGLRRGGAVISPVHANIIVNADGATAKDVTALIAIMREELMSRGVTAEEEIVYLGNF